MVNYRSGEVAFEFGGKQNQRYLFKPLGMTLRGRWITSRIHQTSEIGFTAMPEIPGQVVAVNAKAKTVRVIDPLSFEENENLLEEANRVKEAHFGRSRPHPTTELSDMTDSDVKSVLWCLLEHAENGDCQVVHGREPTRRDVLQMKGQLRLRYMDSSQSTPRYATPDEMARFKEREGLPLEEEDKAAVSA